MRRAILARALPVGKPNTARCSMPIVEPPESERGRPQGVERGRRRVVDGREEQALAGACDGRRRLPVELPDVAEHVVRDHAARGLRHQRTCQQLRGVQHAGRDPGARRAARRRSPSRPSRHARRSAGRPRLRAISVRRSPCRATSLLQFPRRPHRPPGHEQKRRTEPAARVGVGVEAPQHRVEAGVARRSEVVAPAGRDHPVPVAAQPAFAEERARHRLALVVVQEARLRRAAEHGHAARRVRPAARAPCPAPPGRSRSRCRRNP